MAKKQSRAKTRPKDVPSNTGYNFGWCGIFGHWRPLKDNVDHPQIFGALQIWAEHKFSLVYGIHYAAIQVWKNVKIVEHSDDNNRGCNFIYGMGDYKHGELVVIVKDQFGKSTEKTLDIKHKLRVFNPHNKHRVCWYEGLRYSITFYTPKRAWNF